MKLFPEILSLILILAIAVGFIFIAFGSIKDGSYYIVDKGYALSYIDEYAFVHDDVFWFVLGNEAKDEMITVFVNPTSWYTHSVGERYGGPMRNFIEYTGDDSIARYLEGAHDSYWIGGQHGAESP